MNFYNILTENVGVFLNELDWDKMSYRKDFDCLIDSIIDFLPLLNINDFSKMQQLSQITNETQQGHKKRECDFKMVLKHLIKLKTEHRK